MCDSIESVIEIIAKREGWKISELESRFPFVAGFSATSLKRRYKEGSIEGMRVTPRGDITLFSASIITYLRRTNDLPEA